MGNSNVYKRNYKYNIIIIFVRLIWVAPVDRVLNFAKSRDVILNILWI